MAPVANYDSRIAVLLGNGDGTFQPPRIAIVPGGFGLFAIADFNGDGKLDVAVVGRQLEVLPGNGDGTFGAPAFTTIEGLTGNVLLAADLNGDGKPDLVLLNVYVTVCVAKAMGLLTRPDCPLLFQRLTQPSLISTEMASWTWPPIGVLILIRVLPLGSRP